MKKAKKTRLSSRKGIAKNKRVLIIIIILLVTLLLVIGLGLYNKNNKFYNENPRYVSGNLYTANHAANLLDYAYKKENIVLSPYNVNSSLAVLYNATDNNSNKEIKEYFKKNQKELTEEILKKQTENTESIKEETEESKDYEKYVNDIYEKTYDNHTIDTIKLLNTKEKEELLLAVKKADLAEEKLNGLNELSSKKIENYELSEKEKSNNDYYIKEQLDNVLDNYETYSITNEVKNYSEIYTNNVNIKDEFKENAEKCGLNITTLDNDSLNDTKKINDNIKNATFENITRVVEEEDIKENELIMINSLYFNYKWEEAFDKTKVTETEFYTFEEEIKTVEMMYSIDTKYYENQYAKAFVKQFDNEKYSFVGILPNETTDFSLSSLDIDNLLLSKKEDKVLIGLPKINYQSEINLQELLSNYNIKEVFSDKPNLTKMTDDNTKFAKNIQKVKISFGEKGTISTNIQKSTIESYSEDEYKKNIILNRPFAFLIMNNETNEVLFIGKVVTPPEGS